MLSSPDDDYPFQPPSPPYSRSPCPALNALANHGYISRGGKDLTFTEIIYALHLVYNISYPLAFLLTSVGFITCAKLSWSPFFPSFRHPPSFFLFLMSLLTLFIPSWTLDLSALSARGSFKITHDASFVHPDNIPSTAPDPRMLKSLIDYASHTGLGPVDFARYHARRELAAPTKLSNIHEQIALGESALTWLVLRGSDSFTGSLAVVPTERVRQWLGEEKLPDGWWDSPGVRPSRTIPLWKAREVANFFQELALESGDLSQRL